MRTIKSKDSSATKSNEFTATYVNSKKPKHFINFTCAHTGDKIGYMTLDGANNEAIDNTALIELCQEHPDYAQYYFGNENVNARYSQAGVTKSSKAKSKDELLKEFMANKA